MSPPGRRSCRTTCESAARRRCARKLRYRQPLPAQLRAADSRDSRSRCAREDTFLSYVACRIAVAVAPRRRAAVRPPAGRIRPSRPPAAGQRRPANAGPPPAPPKPMPAELPDVLARVNGQPVTKIDFDRLHQEHGGGPRADPGGAARRGLRGALDQLITYNVLKQEAATAEVRGHRRRGRRPGRVRCRSSFRRGGVRQGAQRPGTSPSNSSRPTRASTWPSTR